MSDSTITNLPTGSALIGVEVGPMDQSGGTVKISADQIKTYVLKNISSPNGAELGNPLAINFPYVDFHSSGNYTDYDARIIASAGNQTVGQGTLTVLAQELDVPALFKIGGVSVASNTGATLIGYGDSTVSDALDDIMADSTSFISSLAAPSGATLIGTTLGDTVEKSLDSLHLVDYTALRAYADNQKSVYVTGYLASATPSGIAGMFVRDDSDTTSTDNGGTVIVASNGKRWKRSFSGSVNVKWFGALGNNSSNTPTITGVDISNAAWNVWPSWVTFANYMQGAQTASGAQGHNYGDGTAGWYALNKPFSNSDTWDFIGIQLAIWFCGTYTNVSQVVSVPAGGYRVTRAIEYTGPCRATLKGEGQLISTITANNWATHPLTTIIDLGSTAQKKVLLYTFRIGGVPLDIVDIGFSGLGTTPMGQGTSIDPIVTSGAYAAVVFDDSDSVTITNAFFTGLVEFSIMASNYSGIKLNNVTTESCWYALWVGVGCSIEISNCGFYQSYPAGVRANGIYTVDPISSARIVNTRFSGYVGYSITWKNNLLLNGCQIASGISSYRPITVDSNNVLTGNQISYPTAAAECISMHSNNSIVGNTFNLSGGWTAIATSDTSAGVLDGYNIINDNLFILGAAITQPLAGALIAGYRLYTSSYVNGGQYNAVIGNVSNIASNCYFGGQTQKISRNVNIANTDDYSAGLWTPTLLATTTNPTVVYNGVTTAKYTKIGRQVFLECYLYTTSQSGGTGDAQIGGLPFPVASDAHGVGTVDAISFALPTGGVSLSASVVDSSSTLNLTYSAVNAPITQLPITAWPAGGALISFGVTYTTT